MVSLTGLSPSMDELSISFNYHATVLLMRSYNPQTTTKNKKKIENYELRVVVGSFHFQLSTFNS